MYVAYEVSAMAFAALAKRFPPKYSRVIGHHVTKHLGAMWPVEKDEAIAKITVIGYADEPGLEALVVKVNGTTIRGDGGTFHITWSLSPGMGKAPKMSNDLIAQGYHCIDEFEFEAPLREFK